MSLSAISKGPHYPRYPTGCLHCLMPKDTVFVPTLSYHQNLGTSNTPSSCWFIKVEPFMWSAFRHSCYAILTQFNNWLIMISTALQTVNKNAFRGSQFIIFENERPVLDCFHYRTIIVYLYEVHVSENFRRNRDHDLFKIPHDRTML